MFGSGVLKGLGVTLKEFVATYVDDLKQIPSRYAGGREEIDQRAASSQKGLFTIQYPEERRKVAERFRYIPMLIYEAETGEDRCTACGICAKVCPPQCIWIVRDRDEKGKPITRPSEFYIDTTICMNCGLCAEFCPFDAIKMNHDYEIAAYERMPQLIFDLKELSVPTTYYARIRPTDWAEEEAARKAKEAEKAAARETAPAKPAPVAKPEATPAAATAPAAAAAGAAAAKRTPEEIERLKAEAAARRAAKAAAGDGGVEAPAAAAPAAQPPATEGVSARRSPEEIERLKAEVAARRAAKAAGETPVSASPITQEAPAAPSTAETSAAGTGRNRSPEEIERLKAEAAARRAAKAAGEQPAPVVAAPEPAAPPVEPPPAVETPAAPAPNAGTGRNRSPEEIERLKAEAAARRAAKAAQANGDDK